jgi:hypothetical protein
LTCLTVTCTCSPPSPLIIRCTDRWRLRRRAATLTLALRRPHVSSISRPPFLMRESLSALSFSVLLAVYELGGRQSSPLPASAGPRGARTWSAGLKDQRRFAHAGVGGEVFPLRLRRDTKDPALSVTHVKLPSLTLCGDLIQPHCTPLYLRNSSACQLRTYISSGSIATGLPFTFRWSSPV